MRVGDLVKLAVPCEGFTVGLLLSLSQPVGLSMTIVTVMWPSQPGRKRQHLIKQLEVVSESR